MEGGYATKGDIVTPVRQRRDSPAPRASKATKALIKKGQGRKVR